jgi:hypothetical protein
VVDIDFPLDPEEPVAPITCETTKLDDRDFITASTRIIELEASSDASTVSPSVIAMHSPVSAKINDGIAIAPCSSGESVLGRVIVRPLGGDKLKD